MRRALLSSADGALYADRAARLILSMMTSATVHMPFVASVRAGIATRPATDAASRPVVAHLKGRRPMSPAVGLKGVECQMASDECKRVLRVVGFLAQQRVRCEAVAELLCELVGTGDETCHAVARVAAGVAVAGDVLQYSAGPRREADPHDRTDVGVCDGDQHTLLQASRGLDGLDDKHSFLEFVQVDDGRIPVHREVLAQPGPEAEPLSRLVIVKEAGTASAPWASQLDHLLDDLFTRVARVHPAGGLDPISGLVADLQEELQTQLVGQLQRTNGVASLRGGLLDRGRVYPLGQHGQRLVDDGDDYPAGEETAAVVNDDGRLLYLCRVVQGAGQRRVGRLGAADDLQQRHLVDGGEEVQADEVLPAFHALGQLRDWQR